MSTPGFLCAFTSMCVFTSLRLQISAVLPACATIDERSLSLQVAVAFRWADDDPRVSFAVKFLVVSSSTRWFTPDTRHENSSTYAKSDLDL